MFVKILFISIVLMAFVVAGLAIKIFFNPKAEFPHHSCDLENDKAVSREDCASCELKEIANCSDDLSKK